MQFIYALFASYSSSRLMKNEKGRREGDSLLHCCGSRQYKTTGMTMVLISVSYGQERRETVFNGESERMTVRVRKERV